MDCCNYMQYKFPYYGSYQYYENLPYEREYYAHPYQTYYGNAQCCQQYWPCAAPFPDYVYNPKEARMRKAMREQTRDRTLGTIPAQSRGGRRSQPWQPTPEEQLMMNPPSELHPPLCGNLTYSSPNESYMQQMRSFSKMLPMGNSSNWVPNSSSFVHAHSMEPMHHQQPEMWQEYQEANCGATYMSDVQMHPYSTAQEVIPSASVSRESCKVDATSFSSTFQMQPRQISENVQVNASEGKISPDANQIKKENNLTLASQIIECGTAENTEEYDAQLFEVQHTASDQNAYNEKETKLDELSAQSMTKNTSPATTKVTPLPDFNEAFGSTERGRFQSPPDPRLLSNKCFIDYNILMDDWAKIDDFRI